ncbi:MAG: glutamine-hydrolyzing carbamoyl-phosphate synthase small subunit [Alphaproteobacteria bacterium]|nr:glutamine-hydrolyzing carbamoyl-phosphate synthase small subunit [Alphaproteobacteria bacterium]
MFEDGNFFLGCGFGAMGQKVGELCFNTSITGYQEILTDPSYASQIIAFTFPHIGNVGTNYEDNESLKPAAACGCVVANDITEPSNWRSIAKLEEWMVDYNLIGLSGIDTRTLTKKIRDNGPAKVVIAHDLSGNFDHQSLQKTAKNWSGLQGLDLALNVTCKHPYEWDKPLWSHDNFKKNISIKFRVAVIDYGVKNNILRCLVEYGCEITIFPANSSVHDILAIKPDGVFLSNGPGDPAATGIYAVPVIQDLIKLGLPIFGICLGLQLLALAFGAKTRKMAKGHRGANHPVKEIATGRVNITSQNHGFVVKEDTIPKELQITHISLFDQTVEGFEHIDKPIFAVQYHPEASPGPHDSYYLFQHFVSLMNQYTKRK